METVQQHIEHFIAQQSLATVCCSGPDGDLHCFNCYYTYNEKLQLLYFKTSEQSTHMQYLFQNPALAGTIVPDKLNKLISKGIQFYGSLLKSSHPQTLDASKQYHKRYPFALAIAGTVYTIRIDRLKMTDNNLGFGTRLVWDRSHSAVLAV